MNFIVDYATLLNEFKTYLHYELICFIRSIQKSIKFQTQRIIAQGIIMCIYKLCYELYKFVLGILYIIILYFIHAICMSKLHHI